MRIKSHSGGRAVVSKVQIGRDTFIFVLFSSLQREQSTPDSNVARSAGEGSSRGCCDVDLTRGSDCIRDFSSETRARAVLTRILNRSCPLDNSSWTFESDVSPSTIQGGKCVQYYHQLYPLIREECTL